MDPFLALGLMGAGAALRPLITKVMGRRLYSAELTNWSHVVGDGTLFCTDGSLVSVLELDPPDPGAAGALALQNNGRHIAESLKGWAGWRVHFDLVRTPLEVPRFEGHYPSEGMRWLAAHRARHLAKEQPYRSRMYLSLVEPPKEKAANLAAKWFTNHEERREALHDRVTLFEAIIKDLVGRLNPVLDPRILNADGLLSFLRLCATGLDERIEAPNAAPFYVGHRLLDQDIHAGLKQRVGDLVCATVAITGLPREVEPGVAAFLEQTNYPLRSSLQTAVWSSQDAAKRLEGRIKTESMNLEGPGALAARSVRGENDPMEGTRAKIFMSRGAERAALEIGDGQADAELGIDWFGAASWNVVLWAETDEELTLRVRDLQARFHQRGFQTRKETFNGMAAMHSTWPGHGAMNARHGALSGEATAAVAPIARRWLGEPRHPCDLYPPGSPHLLTGVTAESMQCFLNLHNKDVGHVLVAGMTGSGKSVLAALIVLANLQYEGSRVVVLDKGRSLEPVCRLGNGRHYRLSVEEPDIGLQPFARVDTEAGIVQAVEWLVLTCELNGVEVDSEERQNLATQLGRLAAHDDLVRLGFLVEALPYGPIRSCLENYAAGGLYGALFDSEERPEPNRLEVYELEDLLAMRTEVAIPAATLIIQSIEDRLDGRPMTVLMEEASNIFGHPKLERFARRFLREFRKKNGSIHFYTQSVADPIDAGVPAVFFESFASQIHVPNSKAMSTTLDGAYDALQVSRETRWRIAEGVPKREYIILQDGREMTVDFRLSREELALLSVDAASLSELNELYRESPEGFWREWLER